MKIMLVKYSSTFRDMSWIWLNNEELRFLTNTPSFTQTDQQKWYQNLGYRKDYRIWGIMADNEPIGACGLKDIKGAEGEYWGYIGNKDFRGKGIGLQIIHLIEREAIKYNLLSLWLKVIPENSIAIKLYLNAGYQTERKDDDFVYMRKVLQRK